MSSTNDDLAPRPGRDRPPGGAAAPPGDRRHQLRGGAAARRLDTLARHLGSDAASQQLGAPRGAARSTPVTVDGDSILNVWVTTATAEPSYRHIATRRGLPGVPVPIEWCSGCYLQIIVLAKPGGDGSYQATTWTGFARLEACATNNPPVDMTLQAPRRPNGFVRDDPIAVQVTVGGARLEQQPTLPLGRTVSPDSLLCFSTVAWSESVMQCDGYREPQASGSTDHLGPVELDAVVRETAMRFRSYFDTASQWARFAGAAMEEVPIKTQIATVMGLCAGNYMPEKDNYDDRGLYSIKADDCDGQAAEVALFFALLLAHADAILALLAGSGYSSARGPASRDLYRRALAHRKTGEGVPECCPCRVLAEMLFRYQETCFMFVNACSPTHPPSEGPVQRFGHAVAGLISNKKRGSGCDERFECDEVLLVEATGPVNPTPGQCPGSITNVESNKRSEKGREVLCRHTNVDKLPKGTITVPGIRAHADWLYEGVYVLMTADAAYDGNMTNLQQVLSGKASLERVKCTCSAARRAEKELQLALMPRCYRTADQTPQAAVDPYAKATVPVGRECYLFVSGAGDALDGIVGSADGDVVICRWNVDRLRPGKIVAFGAGACDVSAAPAEPKGPLGSML